MDSAVTDIANATPALQSSNHAPSPPHPLTFHSFLGFTVFTVATAALSASALYCGFMAARTAWAQICEYRM